MLYDINRSLTTIKNSSERIANLVSAVRDYTYGGEANNYDVRKGIESTLLVMEVKLGGVVVERKYLDKQLSPITCYPGALDQVWTNIINNAVEAGAKKIVIDAYMKDEQSIAVRIENDGPQIPPEVLPKIFDRYFSTKSSATAEEERGIGLYMVKEIIEKQHRGRIEVYSDPQKTYFEIILPVMRR
jgi:signal transduction histidine kinase